LNFETSNSLLGDNNTQQAALQQCSTHYLPTMASKSKQLPPKYHFKDMFTGETRTIGPQYVLVQETVVRVVQRVMTTGYFSSAQYAQLLGFHSTECGHLQAHL